MPTLAAAAPAPAPGNSAAAKACQQDGYANLVRADGTAFTNTGDYVSYAAQGGRLKPKATLVVTYPTPNSQIITGTGLQPGSVVTYTITRPGGSTESGTVPNATVASDGTLSETNTGTGCGYTNFVATATTSTGATISSAPTSPPACP